MSEERDAITAEEAREKMLAWANGTLSHANYYRGLGAEHEGVAAKAATEAALSVADAAEAQMWAAVYQALLTEEPSLARRVVNSITQNSSREMGKEIELAKSRLEEGVANCEHERRQASDAGHRPGSAKYEIALVRRQVFQDALSILNRVFKLAGLETEEKAT